MLSQLYKLYSVECSSDPMACQQDVFVVHFKVPSHRVVCLWQACQDDQC